MLFKQVEARRRITSSFFILESECAWIERFSGSSQNQVDGNLLFLNFVPFYDGIDTGTTYINLV